MKAHLLYKDRDFDLQAKLPSHAQALIQDLELNTLFEAMARGDSFLFDVAKKALYPVRTRVWIQSCIARMS